MQSSQSGSLHLHYKFCVDYYCIVGAFDAIMELCDDDGIIQKLGCRALEDERILVYEVLKKLDATIQKIRQRNRDAT